MKVLSLVVGLVLALVFVSCSQGIHPEVEQRLKTLETKPIENPEAHHQLWAAEFKSLNSRVADLERPNVYLKASSVFFEAYLKIQKGDISGEKEVFEAVAFDDDLTFMWSQVIGGQIPIHNFLYTLWSRAFE